MGRSPQTGFFLSGLAPPVGKQYSTGGISSGISWVRSSERGGGALGRHDDEHGDAMDLSGNHSTYRCGTESAPFRSLGTPGPWAGEQKLNRCGSHWLSPASGTCNQHLAH